MRPTPRVRRLDDQLVEALQYTGDNLDQLRAWVGGGYRAADASPAHVTLTGEHSPGRVEVLAWDWTVADGERVYAVRPWEFWSHCRSLPLD